MLKYYAGFLIYSIVILAIPISTHVSADSAVKKNTEKNKITYWAKSGLVDDSAWDIVWSTGYAIAGSSVIYSEKKWDETESSFTGRILSIVGPYVSYQGVSEGYSEGAAHPWSYVYFKTVDLITAKEIKITDIFNEKDIFEALMKDKLIQASLREEQPDNLKSLLELVDGGCDFSLTEDTLSSFVFHHVKGDQVAVRLGLSHGCEVMRGNFTQLGFYLEIPKGLQASFALAKTKEQLMKDMVKLLY